MTHTTINQPHDRPFSQPFVVVIGTKAGTIEVPCETEDDAWEIRDEAIEAGYIVRILGLPLRGCAVFPKEKRWLEIEN